MICLLVFACDSDDAQPGAGGSSGTGASGGAGPGGTGGSAGQGGASGSGGAGAGGGPVEVFNPSLLRPSYECRTDTQSGSCVSISGTLGGMPIDRHCARPDLGGLLARSPDGWVVACYEGPTSSQGYFYQIGIPRHEPGSFHHRLAPGDPDNGSDIVIALDDRGGDLKGSHFAGAELAGKVEHDVATDRDIISGTFRATWNTPDSNCQEPLMVACQAANVHGTFRVVFSMKFD